MWPAAARRLRLEDVRGPTRIDAVARVVSPDVVRSPLSGRMAAFVRIEALETTRDAASVSSVVSLGAILVGDVVTLEVDVEGARSVAVDLLLRRAELRLLSEGPVLPIGQMVPELVPLLARAKGSGTLCQREWLVFSGERLRLSAVVERAYRSHAERLVVRDDLAPVLLDEVLEDRAL
jgi:hypothetical protein